MAADLGLLSLTHPQNLSHSQQQQHQTPNPNPSSTAAGSWMWNPKMAAADDDEEWEVRAFEEDTNHAMGTTWPPRSYTCTFCRREFKSAQALGGHMNVHRRDRAKIHQGSPSASAASTSSSALLIPTQEFMANGGFCFLYSLPNPNPCLDSLSTLLSISPYPSNKSLSPNCPPCISFPVASPSVNSSLCHSSNTKPSSPIDNDNSHTNHGPAINEELDLELRLGRNS